MTTTTNIHRPDKAAPAPKLSLGRKVCAVVIGLWRFVRGFFVCEACGLVAHRKCTFVERPGDGLHDQWQLCADCRKLNIELQKLLYPDSPNDSSSATAEQTTTDQL